MKYQAFFIGVRAFVYSPPFAKLQSAQNWIGRNRHRVVEDLQIIKYHPTDKSKTEWLHETGGRYALSFHATPQAHYNLTTCTEEKSKAV